MLENTVKKTENNEAFVNIYLQHILNDRNIEVTYSADIPIRRNVVLT